MFSKLGHLLEGKVAHFWNAHMMQFRPGQVAAVVVALSIAGYPFVASVTTLIGVEGFLASLVLRAVVLGLAMVLIVMQLSKLPGVNRIGYYLFALLVFYGFRLIFETAFDSETLAQKPIQYWIWFGGVTTIPALSVLMTKDMSFMLAQRMIAGLLFVAAILIAFNGRTEVESAGVYYETGRAALGNLNPISIGNVGNTLVILSLWSMFRKQTSGRGLKYLNIVMLFLGMYLLFISSSRGPLVAMVTAALVLGFTLPLKHKLIFGAATVLLILPIAFYLITLESALNINFLSRLSDVGTNNDLTTSIRTDLYRSAFALIEEYPIFGSAIEIEASAIYPHNFFLEYFMATGIFCGVFSLYVVGAVLLRASRQVKSGQQSGAFGLLFIVSCVGAQFSAAVYSNGPFWVLAAAVAASSVERVAATRRIRFTYRAASARNT